MGGECGYTQAIVTCTGLSTRAGGWVFPSATDYKVPWLLSLENRRKIEPKEKIPSCLIPRLLVIFKWRLEILVTTLPIHVPTDNEEKV